jgi:predicted N-acetyltransferase YhbS
MSLQPGRPPPALSLVPEAPEHSTEIEALLQRAFGPGRFAKVSERVREFADFAPELSFCALEAGRVAGVARMWRVRVGGAPIAFLGPLAVEEAERRHGLGALLVDRACQAAEAGGEAAVLLVGDLPFFARSGFSVAGDVVMPGPVDPQRVLARVLQPGVSLRGQVTAL